MHKTPPKYIKGTGVRGININERINAVNQRYQLAAEKYNDKPFPYIQGGSGRSCGDFTVKHETIQLRIGRVEIQTIIM